MLPPLSVGKLDQPVDLGDRKRGKALMDFVDVVAEIVAVHNSVRHNARSAHHGSSRNLAGDLFNQFASHPVDVRDRIVLRHLLPALHPSSLSWTNGADLVLPVRSGYQPRWRWYSATKPS